MTLRSTRIDLTEDVREDSVSLLNKALVNTLYAQLATRAAMWNARGDKIATMRPFLAAAYKMYVDAADTIASRITALGGIANAYLVNALTDSEVQYDAENDTAQAHSVASLDLLGQIAAIYKSAPISAEDGVTKSILVNLSIIADQLLGKTEAELG